MFFKIFTSRLALVSPLVVSLCSCSFPASAQTKYGDIAYRVASILESEHYTRATFDDKMSSKVLDAYLELLDFRRVYFTQQDIDEFDRKFRTTIDDDLKRQGIPAASEIYGVYIDRVRERVEFAEEVLREEKFTFDSNRTVRITRQDAPWPKNDEEEYQLWRNLIEAELLREELVSKAMDKDGIEGLGIERQEPEEKLITRYRDFLKEVLDNDTEDVATLFIKAIARAYDPHSEYYSRKQYDNFKIGMNKSLKGIGAMLTLDEDKIPTVEGIVTGGPAAKQGELGFQDKILGVGQGDGEIVDVIGKKLSDTVDLIRGEIGTTVTLKVLPAKASDPSEAKLIRIPRDKVDLKDSLAMADLITTKDPEGNIQKIGWIRLSSFYSDMEGGETSTTADVRRLLTRLRIEGIEGLVIDLRDNGGGSLEEAVNMTGLFIPKGPVVQAQNWRGLRSQKVSRNTKPAYNGPLVVLTNRASASASEIFAAALQDYNRAIVIGEKSTFGKGTVQQLRPVFGGRFNLFNRDSEEKGALKLTIQTFFRINGDSTQLKGVVPDLQLPSIYDADDFGESSLSNPLRVDPIPRASYNLFSESGLPVEELRRSMEPRVASNPDFRYIMEDIAEEKKRLERNQVSLNKQVREAERARNKALSEARKAEQIARFARMREEEKDLFRVFTITQDNFADAELVLKSKITDEELSGMSRGDDEDVDSEEKALEYPHLLDPYERETIRVMQDFIAINDTGQPVNISGTEPSRRDSLAPISAGSR